MMVCETSFLTLALPSFFDPLHLPLSDSPNCSCDRTHRTMLVARCQWKPSKISQAKVRRRMSPHTSLRTAEKKKNERADDRVAGVPCEDDAAFTIHHLACSIACACAVRRRAFCCCEEVHPHPPWSCFSLFRPPCSHPPINSYVSPPRFAGRVTMVVEDVAYDFTEFIDQHPGGKCLR